MKKSPLKVLVFLIFLITAYTDNEIPQKILIFTGFIPSLTHSRTYSSFKTIIGGATITIGSNTTGNIVLSSTVFNAAIQSLGEDQFLPVVLNNAGIINALNLTQIGSCGDNNISCQTVNSAVSPDITIISSTGRTGLKRNIILNAAGNFCIASQRITNPISCTSTVLMIDSYGSVSTSNIENLIILGSDNSFKKQKNYITVDNSSNQNGITLDTSYITASSNDIKLNAGLNSINVLFNSSTASLSSLLGIDVNGNLKKVNAIDTVTCGSLNGATNKNQCINFGISKTGNTFSLSDITDMTITTVSP